MVADGVDDIDYIVAHLFQVVDDIHIVDAGLVFVNLVVYVLDILGSVLVAQVVDFALLVVRAYYIDLANFLYVAEDYEHIGHRLLDICEHCVYIGENRVVELYAALLLAD